MEQDDRWRYTYGRFKDLPKDELERRQKAEYKTEDIVETVDGTLLFLTGAVPPVEEEYEGYFLEGLECDSDFKPIGNSFVTLMGLEVIRKVGRVTEDEEIFTWMDINYYLRDGYIAKGIMSKIPESPLRKAIRNDIVRARDLEDVTDSPYIPEWHAGYGLLPSSTADGDEVFAYPCELDALDELIREKEGVDDEKHIRLLPYRYKSYSEYFSTLRECEERYRESDPELAKTIDTVIELVKAANHKEYWSVVRYTGTHNTGFLGLTQGRCYYWPCSPEHPEYEGVIDDEEFTSYLYPCDPSSWEIVEDPTGMAHRALAGEADTVDSWCMDNELANWTEDNKVTAKRKGSYSMLPEESPWGESERDHVDFPCPECGATIGFDAWTKINASEDAYLIDKVIDGSFCEFTCPSCGYQAHLAHPCLYLDPDYRACIYLVANEHMRAMADEMFSGLAEDEGNSGPSGNLRRIVFSREELAEKVAAIEAELDDRAIELLKLGIAGQALMSGAGAANEEYAVRFLGLEEGSLSFVLEFESGNRLRASIPLGAYNLFSNGLQKSSLASDQPFYVDRSWARNASEVLEAEGVMDN